MSASIDLNPKYHKIVSDILYEYAPDREVLVFGSRAKWNAKDKSDLDLCIMGDEPLPKKTLIALTDALSESAIPFKVDIVEWAVIEDGFREIIKRDGAEFRWPKFKISDVAKVVTGKTPPTANKDNFGGTIPFITPSDMNGEKYLEKTSRHITERGLISVKNSYIPEGSIMVSCIGSDMGKVSINRKAGVTNQQINSIIANDSIESEYVYYVLKPRKEEFLALATSGSAQPILNKGHFSALTINVPPRKVQKQIVGILGSLDQKIELNQRMNETLEGMARAIFKSWFVDFDPVHAKVEGRTPEGMDSATAALFPSTFTPDGLPEGWALSEIGDEVTVCGGSTPSTKEPKFWDGDIHWTSPKDLSSLSHPVLLDTERKITVDGLKKITSGLLPKGTVLMSSRAPIGYLAIAEVPVAINQGYIAMIADKKISNVFVWLWTLEKMDEIKSFANGSTFQEISKKNFRPISVCVPDEKVLQAFDELVIPLYQKIVSNVKENQTLAALRDTLLPKLISGELRVDPTTAPLKEAVG